MISKLNSVHATNAFLKKFIGEELVEISRADFLLDNLEDSSHFGPIQLKFKNGSILVIDESGDAESIIFDNKELEFNSEIDPKRWHKIDLSNKIEWIVFNNKSLSNFSLLIDNYNQSQLIRGCKLKFVDNIEFTYFNHYDDSKVSIGKSEILSAFIKAEDLIWYSKINA